MPTIIVLSVAAAASALLAIALEWNGQRHKSFYLLKPLTTALIVGIAIAADNAAPLYRQWIVAALLLSLIGDICLMFRGQRWFAAGLAAFLLAHLAFVAAFLRGVGEVQLPGWLVVIPLYGAALLWWLLPRAGRLWLPVLAYTLVLGGMVFAAAARQEAFGGAASGLALSGALLFLLSDSCLAVRQFVKPYRHAQTAILSTYWTAIGLIAWSV